MSIEAVAAVRNLRGLTLAERALLLTFGDECRRGSRIVSPGAEVADELEVDGSYVRRLVADLSRDRPGSGPLLRRIGGGYRGRRAEYELVFLRGKGATTVPPFDDGERRDKGATKAGPWSPPTRNYQELPAPSESAVASKSEATVSTKKRKAAATKRRVQQAFDGEDELLAGALRWARAERDAGDPYGYVAGMLDKGGDCTIYALAGDYGWDDWQETGR